jgi:hypothetical protein
LAEDLWDYDLRRSVILPLTPEALQTLIDDCVKDAIDQVSTRTLSSFGEIIFLFCDFALHVEQTAPHVDVPEFLRQAGLRAASGE